MTQSISADGEEDSKERRYGKLEDQHVEMQWSVDVQIYQSFILRSRWTCWLGFSKSMWL